MLCGKKLESKKDNKVIIDDVKPDIFDFFIKHMNHHSPNMTSGNVIDILYFTEKYLIKDLKERCLNCINNINDVKMLLILILTINNVYKMHDVANKITKKYIANDSRKLMQILKNYRYS